ncbi:hypothetical membrane protein [Rhodococcus erythropolis]|nr:hypothetical membrane protein [Rhodococcus erythropolis]
MWKQALGFALFGATVAIVTAALTQGSSQASATITLFSGGTTISGFAGESQWAWPIEAAVIGAVLGALTGLVLHLAGVRISGGQDNRMLRTVVAGLVGVTLGLTPLLVLISMAFTRSVDIGWSPLLGLCRQRFPGLRSGGRRRVRSSSRCRGSTYYAYGAGGGGDASGRGIGGDDCRCRYCVEAGLFHRRSHLDRGRTAGGSRIGHDVRCGPGVGSTDSAS